MEAGSLVSDDVMIGIVRERLDAARRGDAGSCSTGFRGRSSRPMALDRMVGGRGPLVVLDIVVPEEVLVRRLASRRICGECGVERVGRHGLTACGKCGGPLVARVDDGDGDRAGAAEACITGRPSRSSSTTRRVRRSGRSTATSRRTW